MSQSTQRLPVAKYLEVPEGSEGVWLLCGVHTSGGRYLFTVSAQDGDEAMAAARLTARDLDPFGEESDWQFSCEYYDCDTVVAMQMDDTQELSLDATFQPVDEHPIPYHLTQKYAAQRVDSKHHVPLEV